jgi:hypothetical protein
VHGPAARGRARPAPKAFAARGVAGSTCAWTFGAVRPCPKRNHTRACGLWLWSGPALVGPVFWCGGLVGDEATSSKLGTMRRPRLHLHARADGACGRGLFWTNGASTASSRVLAYYR